MKRQWKFIVVLIAGVISLIFEFGLHASTLFVTPILKLQMNPQAIIIDILGIWISVLLLMEIFNDWKSGRYGVDILAVIAIVSTILINNYWAEWMILVMSTGGETLADYATGQASKELRSLLNNTPRIATKLVNGKISEVNVEDLKIGDIVLIKPGQQVPVDGEIVKGDSSFDQSSLTGESVPVAKKPGDELMSGSVNGDAAVQMKVTKAAKDSEYQSIVALVKSAQAQPAKFVKMADRYAVPFTIISLIIGGVAWAVSGDATRFAEVMVVASPCPLLIAAPVALVSGMSSMSAHHIIVKSGPTLEKLARAKTFAFDKTGTLTENQLVIDQIIPEGDGLSKEELQSLAASVEQQSSHVIASSLVKATDSSLIKPVTNLKETTAQGVEGDVDGKHVKVGKLSFVAPDHEKIAVTSTAVFVSVGGKFAGYITMMDEIRPETAETIAKLKRQGAEDIMMLTGDHMQVAEKVGKKAGITDIRANLLPAEKIKAIKEVPKDLRPVV
ncbi:heavy metal translocating P-type ATPase, partial [Lactobacillus helveticus]